MSLKRVVYTDLDGRKKIVLLPDTVLEEEAEIGIPVGPPPLSSLGLPLEIEVRLNNELFNRGIITQTDALRKRLEVMYAIQSVFKVDANRVVALYLGEDYRNARQESPEKLPNTPLPNRGQSQPRQRPRVPVSRSRSRA